MLLIIWPIPLQISTKNITAPTAQGFVLLCVSLSFFFFPSQLRSRKAGETSAILGVGWGGEENLMEPLMTHELLLLRQRAQTGVFGP